MPTWNEVHVIQLIATTIFFEVSTYALQPNRPSSWAVGVVLIVCVSIFMTGIVSTTLVAHPPLHRWKNSAIHKMVDALTRCFAPSLALVPFVFLTIAFFSRPSCQCFLLHDWSSLSTVVSLLPLLLSSQASSVVLLRSPEERYIASDTLAIGELR